MYIVEIVLLVAGLALLVVGYRKNSRNMLVAAALALLACGALGDLIAGFRQGLGI